MVYEVRLERNGKTFGVMVEADSVPNAITRTIDGWGDCRVTSVYEKWDIADLITNEKINARSDTRDTSVGENQVS